MADETRWRVTSDEARRDFRALLDSVLQERAHVEVSRYNTPVAMMVPIAWYRESVRIREVAARVMAEANDRVIADMLRDGLDAAPTSPEDPQAEK